MSTKNTLDVSLATEEQKGHILGLIKSRLEALGITNPKAQAIITHGGQFQRRVDAMLAGFIAEQLDTFTVTLDPTIGMAEWVRRGNYEYANPDIRERNFKLTPTGTREVVLYDPKGAVSSEEMIRRMKADGYKPAGIDDCLAMGAQFPERQRQNPIVFLGSVWRGPVGGQLVPVLYGWRGRRKLGLGWFDGGWGGSYRFAAVRES
jgi:hypothetical protein